MPGPVQFRFSNVKPILWPLNYKAIGEKPNPYNTHQVRLFCYESSHIRLLLMIQPQILAGDPHRGHLGSPEVTNRFLPITHDWKELQTWAWSLCAFLVTTHRLVATWVNRRLHVTLTCGQILTWPDPWPDLTAFRRAFTIETRWCPNNATSSRSSKVI